jgi:hypothetical protein
VRYMIITEVSSLEEISTNEMFADNDVFQFVIPSIQRDYQWGIGNDSGGSSNDSAYAFIEDLIRFSHGATSHQDPYFLGTFIVYSSSQGDVNVMDGQQRWTTLTALMGAIYHILDSGVDEDWSHLKEEISQTYLLNEDELPFLLSKVPHDNSIIELISYFHGTESIDSLPEEVLEGSGSFNRMVGGKSKKYKGRNLACVAKYFVDRLKSEFGVANAQSSRQRLVNFLKIINKRVLVNLTFTDTSRVAFKMFITANARGTPLNNFDILRGLVLARNQILTDEDINLVFDNLFAQATLTMDQLIGKKDSGQKNKQIDKFISDSLSIYTGERVSKSGCLGVLEDKINNIDTQEGLFSFVGYFLSYLKKWQMIVELWPRPGGMLEHSRIAYSQSQVPQHTVLYTAALIAEWTEAQLIELLTIIQCFVMRSLLGGTESPKEWYSTVPTIGYRILNPQGRTRDDILTSLSQRFEESQHNPTDAALAATLSAKQFQLNTRTQKGALVALFHALDGARHFLSSGGQHIKVERLMPYWDWRFMNVYTYGDERMDPGLFSSRLGNIFAIRGTIQELSEITNSHAEIRIGEFRERASGLNTTLYYLDDETEWGHEEINERTEWLTNLILTKFPHSCD